MSDTAVPTTCRELRSTVTENGDATLVVAECEVPEPGPDQVVVRVEAAPINPSDLGLLFAMGDISRAVAIDGGFRIPLTPGVLAANRARVGIPMPAGNEGGGRVVAAGSSPAAQALLGKVVGFVSGNSYAEYRTVHHQSCIAMADGVTPEQAAAPFVNPLTALGMVETMRMEGHTGLVHTVGASNLGLMLNRICLADGVPLVNLVRRDEHVELLRSEGAEHVVDTSAPTFTDDLRAALRATGATIAFDAIGGGELASTLLAAMEAVASEGATFSRYGSDTHKQVYIYGSLDRSPTVLHRTFGLSWSVGGWLLTPFLGKLGVEGAARLRQRVADEITTTFASRYGLRLSLDEAVDPAVAQRYGRMASGDKALVLPNG
jgi:NADPH:quinone reductase-like Zn-dependent oxidoreductase